MVEKNDVDRLSGDAVELYERLMLEHAQASETLPEDALAQLRDWGLVWERDGQVLAQAPEDVTRGRLNDLESRAAAVRHIGDDLAAVWRRHKGGPEVELLVGDQITMMLDTLINTVQHTLLSTSIPAGIVEVPLAAPAGEADALARGVVIKAIYSAELLDVPHGMDLVRACVSWGEEARLLPNVPGIFLVCDNTLAAVVPPYEVHEARQMFVLRSPGMVEVFRRFFERLWAQALPVDVDHESGADEEPDHQLLVLLANGLSDRAVAREMGISERTLSRRITTLAQRYGAQSRFQLGFQAARMLAPSHGAGGGAVS